MKSLVKQDITLIHIVPFSGYGGTQEYSKLLLNKTKSNIFKNKVLIAPNYNNDFVFPLKKDIKIHSLKLVDEININSKNYLKKIIGVIKLIFIIKRYASKNTVVHSNLCPFSFLLMRCWLSNNIKLINTCHDFGILKKKSRGFTVNNFLYKIVKLLNKKVLFITPSNFIKKQLYKLVLNINPNVIHVINTGIPSLSYKYNPKKFNKNEIKILTIGRLHTSKGWSAWLDMVNQMNKLNSNIIFSWYGNGPDVIKFNNKIRLLKINNVEHVKHFDNIEQSFQKYNYFIFSSKYEGGCLPRGLQEVMHFGLPVLIPDLPSIKESFNKNKYKYSFLYKPQNPKSLTDSLIKMINLKEKDLITLTINNKDYISKHHNYQSEVRKTEILYIN